MAKLKMLKMHDLKDVPPEVIEQLKKCSHEICDALENLRDKYEPNVWMGAVNYYHSAIVFDSVSTESLEDGRNFSALVLMKNIDFLADQGKKQESKGQD